VGLLFLSFPEGWDWGRIPCDAGGVLNLGGGYRSKAEAISGYFHH
jgi:hypothetical protein